uniref:Uncharacterized protein n=1 Tax=Lygus hesperus TaxID=30085 RepID=A0A146MAC4_LYGHE
MVLCQRRTEFPNSEESVVRDTQYALRCGLEGANSMRVAQQGCDAIPCLLRPNLHGVVITATYDTRICDCQCSYPSQMLIQRYKCVVACVIPHPDGSVVARCDDHCLGLLRVEDPTPHWTLVTHYCVLLSVPAHAPLPYRVVVRARQLLLAVWAVLYASYDLAVACEGVL